MHRHLIPALALAAFAWPIGVQAAGETAAQRAKEAAISLQRNDPARAIAIYSEALADTSLPNDRRAALHNDRGVAYARNNQNRAAIEDFNRSVQIFPENPSAYNNRGNVLLTLGHAQEALKDFDRAIQLAPGYAAAYSNRAHARTRLGDAEGASRDFAQAARLAPQSVVPLAGRGRQHLAQNRPHAALRDFSRAIAQDAKFAAGYKARAEAKVMLERFEDAVEDLSRAQAFEPANIEIYLLRGYCYLAARNVSSAIKDFQRATELDPRSTAALTGLGLAQAKADAHDDALNHLARALEIDPRSAQAYAYRAVVYKWMGQPELGEKDIERALKLDPALPEVMWARGEFAEANGNTAEAIADLKKAATGRPLLRDAVTALDRLGAGPEDEAKIPDLGHERWTVVLRANRYYAVNADLPRLSVPLETIGEGLPQIRDWDLARSGVRGVGVLTFHGGRVTGKDGPEDVEQGAVIDTVARAVIAIETISQGDRKASWVFEDQRLEVTGIDGFKEEYPLRRKDKDVAQPATPVTRRVASEPTGPKNAGGVPSWAPWAQQGLSQPEPRGNRQRPPQQKPKTLFDMIFKSN